MHRRNFLAAMAVLAGSAAPVAARDGFFKRLFGARKAPQAPGHANKAKDPGTQTTLSRADAEHGLRQALRIGIDAVTLRLGTPGGFLDDPKVRIALPKTLRKARKLTKPLGMAAPFDDLQARMNHAAEAAMPQGRTILVEAVNSMSIDDALAIVRGPGDSATQYLRRRMEPSLRAAFTPVVRAALDQSGAMKAGKSLARRYALGRYAAMAEQDLTRRVVKGALKGVFYYLAQEERQIRAHPGAFASALLKKVFG